MRDAGTEPRPTPRQAVAARVAIGGAAALLGLSAVALWASQGAGVFLESAFAAVIACF